MSGYFRMIWSDVYALYLRRTLTHTQLCIIPIVMKPTTRNEIYGLMILKETTTIETCALTKRCVYICYVRRVCTCITMQQSQPNNNILYLLIKYLFSLLNHCICIYLFVHLYSTMEVNSSYVLNTLSVNFSFRHKNRRIFFFNYFCALSHLAWNEWTWVLLF